jgi:hypothetical protein
MPIAPLIKHWFNKWTTEGKHNSYHASINKEHGSKLRASGCMDGNYV